MYLSGNLIKEKIKANYNNLLMFDEEKITFNNFALAYTGFFEIFNWEENSSVKEHWKQENEIMLLTKSILNKVKRPNANGYIENFTLNLVQNILKSSYKYIYVLLELLNYILNNSLNLYNDLQEFKDFYTYLCSQNTNFLTQIDINILIKQFLNGKEYKIENLNLYKQHIFCLDEDKLPKISQTIVTFGEFIRPKRVINIAKEIQENPDFTKYIAPIYFLLPTSKDASTFLYLNRHQVFDHKLIYHYAQKCGAPKNILKLIKK